MNRRTLLVGAGTVATTALAGCTGSAQTEAGDEPRTLTVSNSGTVDAEPNLARISASVEATGDGAETVRDELATRSDRLYDRLVESGIDEENITTDRVQIRDRVDRRRIEADEADPQSAETREEYTYYEGTHAFTIEVADVDAVGTVVDTAVDSGADTVGRIEFTLSDDRRTELRQEALESAIASARTEAEFVAGEVDKSVVDVKEIDTSDGRVSAVQREVATEAADGATEVRPDDVTVRATARVTYTIG